MSQPADRPVPPDQEIVTTRVVEAPAELVFRAWTEPERVVRWWGPTGFRTTTKVMDVRPGGQWRFTMHGPDGHDYENRIEYLVVEPPTRLVYRHGGEVGVEPVSFTTTVTFETLVGPAPRTRVTMRAVFPTKQARDRVAREYGAVEGGVQHLARLAEHVAVPTGPVPFATTRVFSAPRELVWRAWTERERLMQWFGPKGCTIPTCSLDLRPGGFFHYGMKWAAGGEMWGKWQFREIVAPERLVFLSSFSDPQGAVARAPFPGPWPLLTLSTVTFEPHAGIGRGTVVTVRGVPHEATAEEIRAFADGHPSMTQGWGGTFDQLAAFLAKG